MNIERSNKVQKILIGGVPFGKDNVGDEAILECVVFIVKAICPDAEILASTDDQEATEKKLGVKTVPLFGFDTPGVSQKEMLDTIKSVDAFVWAGATGLSDYPEIPLQLLQCAVDNGKKTAVFCTGMNSELNPYLYTLLPGRRHQLFSLIRLLSFRSIDLIERYESKRKAHAAAEMEKGIESAGLVILRDAQSSDAMSSLLGGLTADVSIGADPAIEIMPKPLDSSGFSDEVIAACSNQNFKIGLCLSAQGPVKQLGELAALFDRLISSLGVSVVGIPMNPITDSKLMSEFRDRLKRPDAMCVAEGRFEPDEIAGLASEMDVVISSRLHLLILASISLTPFIGISRGSKISNFSGQFGLPEVGSVEALNIPFLEDEIVRLLKGRAEFEATARPVRAEMLNRLEMAKLSLSRYLTDSI